MKVGTDGVLLGAWANLESSKLILDIGTGTGLIALMAAQRNTTAIIHGIDIDNVSYLEACENISISPWQNRIKIFNENITNFDNKYQYDTIISNPPFFENGLRSDKSQRDLARSSKNLPASDLIESVIRLLSTEGRFCMIYPYQPGIDFVELAKRNGLHLSNETIVRSRSDRPPERLLMEFKLKRCPTVRNELVIYKQNVGHREYTADCIALTKDFYINL
jgi:tRNA1Val (adenine37-N6)-methyltransferase